MRRRTVLATGAAIATAAVATAAIAALLVSGGTSVLRFGARYESAGRSDHLPGATPVTRRDADSGAFPVSGSPKASKKPAPDPKDIVPGRWTVALDKPVSARVRVRLRRAGLHIQTVSGDGKRLVVRGELTQERALSHLAALPGAEYAEPVTIYRATVDPTDPMYSQQWGPADISAPLAWNTTTGSASTTIAVVDTGLDQDHVEFTGRVADGHDYANGDGNPEDDEGHGTHVSGIAAAALNNGAGGVGIAPDCTVLPVKVLGSDGTGYNTDIAEGIRYAADNGAKVINLSLEGSYSDSIVSAVNYALGKDAVLVAAAGNSGTSVAYPAALEGVVAVSAVTQSHTLADFSNRGSQIDVAAPGVGIFSTYLSGSYANYNGTSMASPFVAGTVALMRSANPSLTQADVVQRLKASADDLGAAGSDDYFGAGLVNAARAVAQATSGDDDAPPGIALPASPATGTLNAATDTDDVFAFSLIAGETVEMTLTATGTGDFDLRLFGPGTDDIRSDVPVASSVGSGNPKSITHTAGQTGVFYIDARAESGSCEYSIAYRVIANDPADDDVPGVPLPVSPVSGTLAAGTDSDDVFRIELARGDRLTASLQGAVGSDFDLYLFPPGTTTVDFPSAPVAVAADAAYPKTIAFTALAPGIYYLNPYAASGSGAYTLTWAVTEVVLGPDDDIPGVALSASPVSGALHDTLDPHDVYYVDLVAGRQISTTLTASSTTDFDLYLYGPDAEHVMVPDQPVAASASAGSVEAISYTAPTTGRYYIDVFSYSGAGNYSLQWVKGTPPVITITGVTHGQRTNASVTPNITISSWATTHTITLDGSAYTTGTPISAEGPHTLFVSAADEDGNNPTRTVQFTIDRTPPNITFGGVVNGATYAGSVAPTFTIGSDAATWTVTLDGTRFVSGTNVIAEGNHTLIATARDDVGNSATRRVDFAIDTTPPMITIGGVANGHSYTATVTPTVSIASDAVTSTVTLNGAPYVPGTPVGDEGSYNLLVTGQDAAGNIASKSVAFEIRIGPPPAGVVTITSSPATLTVFGQSWNVTGTLTGDGMLLDGRQVELLASTGGAPASVIATAVTGADGVFAFTVAPVSATAYTVQFGGDAGTSASLPSNSIAVLPAASVGKPSAPTSVFRTKSFSVSGSLAPAHTAGSASVRILKYLKVGTSWQYRYSVKATLTDGPGGSGYAATLSLPTSGTWKLVAQHDLDAEHAQSTSAESYITVKDVIVGTPIAPSRMRHTTYYAIHGTLKPAHTKGTRPVVIRIERKVGGSYRPYKDLSATITATYSTYSRYARSIRLPYSGRWRLRAYHPADAAHPAAWSSSYDYVYVE